MSTHTRQPIASRMESALFAPIDPAPLAFFRVLFGMLLFWEVTRYFRHGWIARIIGDPPQIPRATVHANERNKRLIRSLLAIYFALQILVPLRHWLYPGNVSWTEKGHLFSWHMKLRDKRGTLALTATNPAAGKSWPIDPNDELTPRQCRIMATHPDMIAAFCQHLAEEWRRSGRDDIAIHARASVSLNGHPTRLLIDPTVDLTRVHRSIFSTPWILR